MNTPYVETDCVIEHAGRKFEAGGAVVTDSYVIGYPHKDGSLRTWHGEKIGTYRITSSWPTPFSHLSPRMCQIEARVDGRTYTGRGAGEGMIFKGRRIAKERNKA